VISKLVEGIETIELVPTTVEIAEAVGQIKRNLGKILEHLITAF